MKLSTLPMYFFTCSLFMVLANSVLYCAVCGCIVNVDRKKDESKLAGGGAEDPSCRLALKMSWASDE